MESKPLTREEYEVRINKMRNTGEVSGRQTNYELDDTQQMLAVDQGDGDTVMGTEAMAAQKYSPEQGTAPILKDSLANAAINAGGGGKLELKQVTKAARAAFERHGINKDANLPVVPPELPPEFPTEKPEK